MICYSSSDFSICNKGGICEPYLFQLRITLATDFTSQKISLGIRKRISTMFFSEYHSPIYTETEMY